MDWDGGYGVYLAVARHWNKRFGRRYYGSIAAGCYRGQARGFGTSHAVQCGHRNSTAVDHMATDQPNPAAVVLGVVGLGAGYSASLMVHTVHDLVC